MTLSQGSSQEMLDNDGGGGKKWHGRNRAASTVGGGEGKGTSHSEWQANGEWTGLVGWGWWVGGAVTKVVGHWTDG